MVKFKCTHCGKDDFRTRRGLSQHLLTKLACRDKETARLTSRKSEESQLSYDLAQAQQQQGLESDNESLVEPNSNRLEQQDDQGGNTIGRRLRSRKKTEESAMDEDDNGFPVGDDTNEEGSEVNDYSGEESLGSLGSKHPNFADDMDSDDDEGAKSQDSGVTPTKTTDPSGMVRSIRDGDLEVTSGILRNTLRVPEDGRRKSEGSLGVPEVCLRYPEVILGAVRRVSVGMRGTPPSSTLSITGHPLIGSILPFNLYL